MKTASLNRMSTVREALDMVHRYGKAFLRSLLLLWGAAPGEIIFMTGAILLQGTIPVVSIWLTKQVIDTITLAVTQGHELGFEDMRTLVAAWVGALLLNALLSPWITATQGTLQEKLTAHLNLLLIRKAESLPDLNRFENPQFYDELQLIWQQAPRPLVLISNLTRGGPQLFTVVTMFGLLVPIGLWIPALILGTTLPQAYVSSQLQIKYWDIATRKSSKSRWLQYCTSVMLTDTYAKEVRLFKLGPFFTGRYLEAFWDMHRAMSHIRRKQALWSTSLAVLSALGNAFAFYWVVQQAFNGKLSPGNIVLIVQALAYIQENLSQLVQTSTALFDNLLYMERLFKFLESKPTMTVCFPGLPVSKPLRLGITFDRVHFCYPDGRAALAGVSFTLHPGETVALVGENGAGKTTIVKLLARLYDPTTGVIRVDGEDLQNLELEAWRRQIAIVFQDFGRYALTLEENIALGDLKALNELERLRRATQRAGLAELVEQLPSGYQTLLGKQFDGTELSGGQWQKVALARAFFREDAAQILILDEPTAALDPRSESEIYHRFAELMQGKTTLLITHRLASVSMADRILVLKNGQLIEEGTHQMLLQQEGEYSTLWNMQAEKYRI